MVLAQGTVVRDRDVVAALEGGAAAGGSGFDLPALPDPALAAPKEVRRTRSPERTADRLDPGADGRAPDQERVVEIPRPPAAPAAAGGPLADPTADLTGRMRDLLSLVRERGRVTTQEHMASSGTSHRTALRDLQALAEKGLIERVGSRRGAYYRPSEASRDLGIG